MMPDKLQYYSNAYKCSSQSVKPHIMWWLDGTNKIVVSTPGVACFLAIEMETWTIKRETEPRKTGLWEPNVELKSRCSMFGWNTDRSLSYCINDDIQLYLPFDSLAAIIILRICMALDRSKPMKCRLFWAWTSSDTPATTWCFFQAFPGFWWLIPLRNTKFSNQPGGTKWI